MREARLAQPARGRFVREKNPSSTMIFVTNASAHVVYVSPEWQAVTGLDLSETVNFGWAKVVHPADRALVKRLVADARDAQMPFQVRYRLLAKDGSSFWVDAGAVPSFGPPGRTFLGFFGSINRLEQAPAETEAVGGLGTFDRPQAYPAQSSELEQVADHLLAIHALLDTAMPTGSLELIRMALLHVGQELAQAEAHGPPDATHH